ncbi:hypothetical protein TELCIR_13059, partial [Teladorsagia circumcincta]
MKSVQASLKQRNKPKKSIAIPGDSALQLYKSLEKGGGEFLSYLDSDLTLADQNDEFSEMKSDRYPPLSTRPEKAVYSAAPVKASFVRSVPSYDEIYSGSSGKPILKAYDIDLSIHIDASTSMAAPRLGRVTCTFDEVDAYRPRTSTAKMDLPLIVKPLRQFDRESTLERRSRSTETRDQPFVEARQPRVEAPALCRRRTMGGADDAKPKWYSSSVDGGPESSTLPKNFLRKPSVLHTAAPVEVAAIPFIDDDVPAPPKPARSYTELGGFAQDVPDKVAPRILESFEKKSGRLDLLTCVAKPVQLVDPVASVARRDPKPLELNRSSFLQGPSESAKALPKSSTTQNGVAPDTSRKRYPWHTASTEDEKPSSVTEVSHEDDRDLVPEFVQNGGLDCMVRLGRLADQNHQNYILRALGQVMLYVDGMNGIIAHNTTIQWLYELLDSPLFDEKERREMSPFRLEWFRLVVKTALKLLLVFIEYNDNNALLVLAAISAVDRGKGQQDWSGLMKVISEKDSPDPETLVYGMTVINKTLRGIPDS